MAMMARERRRPPEPSLEDSSWCEGYCKPPSDLHEKTLRTGWTDAGIVSKARPWSTFLSVLGTVLGLSLLVAALPVLLPLALFWTATETFRDLLGLDESPSDLNVAEDDGVSLVMPGTCAYVFWQLGMVQYLCDLVAG